MTECTKCHKPLSPTTVGRGFKTCYGCHVARVSRPSKTKVRKLVLRGNMDSVLSSRPRR